MRLSIIIVNWNARQVLLDCLDSIERHPPTGPVEVIVVDNASTDGSVESIRRQHPRVILLANDANRGFAAANDQAIVAARGRYLLLLNPDTVVHPQALDTLCAFLDGNPDVGACGPKLLNADGTLQASARHFPSFRGALHRHTAFHYLHIFRGPYRRWLMKGCTYDKQMEVDQLMGAALLLRRSALDQVGLLDEQFFMYYEEVDLCYRLKEAGWRRIFVPEAVITHLGGQSSGRISVGKRVMMLNSLLRYFRKHRGRWRTALFGCVFKPGVLLRCSCQAVGAALTYAGALLTWNRAGRMKSAVAMRTSATLLARHSWWLLFRA